MEWSRDDQIREARKRLLVYRKWAYLRYLHLREAFFMTQDVRSVLAVGCGRGLAELALALEFPETRWHLTDIDTPRTPNYQRAQELVDAWAVQNVTFGVLDILTPLPRSFDLVASVEVLEHIEDHRTAARHMLRAASRYVFALVPFADQATNADPRRRQAAWRDHEHWRVGYDEHDLHRLFPNTVAIRGCYWADAGGQLRARLHDMSDQEIIEAVSELVQAAEADVKDALPETLAEAQGIWALARAS